MSANFFASFVNGYNRARIDAFQAMLGHVSERVRIEQQEGSSDVRIWLTGRGSFYKKVRMEDLNQTLAAELTLRALV